jgi:hypothetical protein
MFLETISTYKDRGIIFFQRSARALPKYISRRKKNYTEKLLPEPKKRQPTADHCHGKNLLRQQRKIVYESFKYANLMSSLSLPLCSCISCKSISCKMHAPPKSCSPNINKGNKSALYTFVLLSEEQTICSVVMSSHLLPLSPTQQNMPSNLTSI